MSFLKKKKVHGIPLFVLVALAICVVGASAVFYTLLQFTSTATVAANPKVCFVDWTDGTTKANSFSMAAYNIFPSIRTINENISYGLWNWDTASHTCYIRIYSLTTTANINYLNITIYNGTAQVFTQKWTDFGTLPTSWSSGFTAAPSGKYAIWWEVNATAAASGSSVFTVELKPENP